jgi:hypothetical protein
MKRNIRGGISLLFFIALSPLTHKLNKADCGYQVHGTGGKISHLLYMDDLKLLSRSEDNLENELQIVKAISKDITMNFGLEKCARICFKKGRVKSKIYRRNTFEKCIKEMDLREACKYLGIEESYDTEHKNEKEKLKKEYLRFRLVLGTELSAIKQLDHWQYQYLDIVLELLTAAKSNCKN